MSDELAGLDATAQSELICRRELSPAELVEAAIERLERLNPRLNAVIFPAIEEAREHAASSRLGDGPFRGVPFLLKDLGGGQGGRPYCGGMRFLKEARWRESSNAYLTERFLRAGLVVLGRTNTPELGLLPTTEPDAFGPTRNPWDPEHSAGGSSGGSAAAVAAGIVAAAHASDGGGSIRIPASSCGLVGLKTSRGRCSFGPGGGERWSGFSVEFTVTRSVRDAAGLLAAVAGPMPGDPYHAPPPRRPWREAVAAEPGPLRIGVMRRAPRDRGFDLHPECLAAVDRAARVLDEIGHRVEEAHPAALDDPGYVMLFVDVIAANTAHALEAWGAKLGRPIGREDVEPLTWALAERGRKIPAHDHLARIDAVHAFGRRLASWWADGFDLLLTPTTAAPPPAIGFVTSTPDEPFRAFLRSAPYGAYTSAFNLSGQPAISVPLHWTVDGLPVGVHLGAAYGREDVLLQVAAQLEAAAPWKDRRPLLFG